MKQEEIMSLKEKAIRDRIKYIEDSIIKAQEYLESGKHAHWQRFRPWFVNKVKDGEVLPPHRDWVKNVFLRRCEKSLFRNQKRLDKMTQKNSELASKLPPRS